MDMTKTTKVALINSPMQEKTFHHPLLLPLSLAYLAAVLKREGHEVKVIDCPACEINHEQLKKELSTFDPALVGITSTTPNIVSALKSASAAKEASPDIKVIIGGPHVTFRDKETLTENPAVDVVVRGEGELTMLELAQKAPYTKDLTGVNGITIRHNGDVVRTAPRAFIQNLDELPRPAYEFFNLEKYKLYGKQFMPILTSRGCPFQCAFCVTTQLFGAPWRHRSAKNVVDELEWLKKDLGADGISFYDDTLTLDKQRLFDICDAMAERKLELPWGCQTRVDQVNTEILTRMKLACCNEVSFGVESGCQKTLDKVHKKTSVQQNIDAVKLAKNEGLFVAVSALVAYPGETLDDVKQTIDLLRKMQPDDAYICIATPYPGTELRSLVENMGWKISDNWSLYDTMNPVIDNPLVPAEEIAKLRKQFYNELYSPAYVLRQFSKGKIHGNFYSQLMMRLAIGHLYYRVKSVF
jgi:anaerobic magnesium-protoporphyrin IX monomethyl ester cyclase